MNIEVLEQKRYGKVNPRLVLYKGLYKTLIFVDGKISSDGGEIIHCARLPNHTENTSNMRQAQREFFLICCALKAAASETIQGDAIHLLGRAV